MRDATLTTPNTGVALNYRVWDSPAGRPTIVLVHGLGSTLRIWDLVAPLLAQHHPVVAYDQRGHASSEKLATGYDLHTMVADLTGLLDALNLDRPFVVGHSWGATLALALAALHPDRPAGIALVDGGLFDLADMPGATWETLSRDLAPPDLSSYTVGDIVGHWGGGALQHVPVEFMEEFVGAMMNVQPDGTIRPFLTRENHMQILRTMYETSSEMLLSRVRCPLLALLADPGGAHDERQASFMRLKRLGAERVEKFATNSPRTKVLWLEQTIHDVPLQRPDVLARELLGFFG